MYDRFQIRKKPCFVSSKRWSREEGRSDYETVLDGIENHEDICEEIEACDGVQLRIRTKIMEIDEFLKRVEATQTDIKLDKTSSSAGQINSRMRLSKLEIMKFGGNPREYITFKDAFWVAIEENSSLSNVERFTYLKSFLTGEAEGCIKGLAATDANYREALEILDQRYGNKQVIVNSHMDALIKLPQVTGVNSTKNIRKLYNEIETNLRSLKSLGVKPDSYGCLLIPILLSKLPYALNLQLSRRFDTNTDVWEVDKIMEELKRELEARERCYSATEKNDQHQNSLKRDYSTTEALYAGNTHFISCAYCDGKHYSDQCRIVTDVNKRNELLKRKKKCFLCTRFGHLKRDCTTKRSCFRCKGSHHTSVCEKNEDGIEKKNERDRKEDTEETRSIAAFSSINTILLQTAQLEVQAVRRSESKNGNIVCKVILDSGSQRSYITRKAAEAVGALIHHKGKMQIGGFGGTTTKEKLHSVVEVLLSKKDYEVKVKL